MTTPISGSSVPINIVQKLEEFYRDFQEKPGVPKYLDLINDLFSRGENTLVVLYEDLLSYDSDIADMLREDPEVIIKDAIEAFKNTLKFNSSTLAHKDYFVRFCTKDDMGPLAVPIRGLRAKHIDKLVWFNGITIRSSTVRPKLTKAKFECTVCGASFEIPQITSQVSWPRACIKPRCKAKSRADFRLISKKSEFIDWQSIMIQEVPEELPSGRIPRSVQAILMNEDLVDTVKPGDRVKIMGIFKSVIAQSIKNLNSTLFKSYIEVNFIEPEDKIEEDLDLTKEDKEQIELLAKEPMVHKKIARSLAPTIYGRDDLKMACALSLFSGTRRKKPGGGYKRGDIHVLFMGDPGTGKSVHGDEKIYINKKSSDGMKWDVRKIRDFVEELLEENKKHVIKKGETELLRLSNIDPIYTASMNPSTLKTHKSKIKEISRHTASILVQIKTESGRSIISTPDHSFTTLIDGKLNIINSENLFEEFEKDKLYLPIARKLDFSENLTSIDMNQFFKEDLLVSLSTIQDQISLYKKGMITSVEASNNSNIARSTLLMYKNKPPSVPNKDWIRNKYDCSWIPGHIQLDEKLGEVIGLYLAEGDLQKNSIRITNTNKEIIDLLKSNLIEHFDKVSHYSHDNTIQLHNASMTRWFNEKFGTHAEQKQLPYEFLFTPIEFRRGLISGYFAGDGTIEKNKLYIDALTASKDLAYSISDMLSTFGIFSTIGRKLIKSSNYKGNKYYKIILTGDEVIKFHQKFRFLSSRKQERLECAIELAIKKTRFQKKDIIPNFGNILQKISKDIGLRSVRNTEERSFLGQLRGKTQRKRCGRLYLQRVVKKFEELYYKKDKRVCPELKWLKILIYSDIVWDKVRAIKI
ncbi:MAG: LAGLIDADG family homing endonuclease, partial [Promethearchaeota archaeon]